MGNCCCSPNIDEEDEFQKNRKFTVDNKIFTLRKYGNTDNQNEPSVNGRKCNMKSFKEPNPHKNRNIKKTSSTKKSKRNSSKKSTKTDRDFVRTSSMVEFCEDVSYLQSNNWQMYIVCVHSSEEKNNDLWRTIKYCLFSKFASLCYSVMILLYNT